MSTYRLIVASPEAERSRAESIAGRIGAAWGSFAEVPSIEHLSFERLGSVMARGWTERLALVIVLGPDAEASLPAKITDTMLGALIPGVVLVPSLSARLERLTGKGVLIESWDADPMYLAATLRALCERQETVRELCQEVDRLSSYQGGIHGEMTRLHDELNLAAMIQRELLPKSVPTVAEVEFGVLFRPAGYVSGDIYDVSMIGEDRVGFFIADAVGHGVPAALLTVLISRGLRVTGDPTDTDPGRALARLNEEMIACQRDANRFATAVAGLVDLRTRTVTLSSAGHPPALRVRADGHRPISDGGPLLGVFPDQDFPTETFRLEDDETLLLYSDGFEVAFDGTGENIREAKHAYVDRLCSLPWPTGGEDRSVSDAMGALATELDRQSGSLHQADDLTAIAIAPRAHAQAGRINARAA